MKISSWFVVRGSWSEATSFAMIEANGEPDWLRLSGWGGVLSLFVNSPMKNSQSRFPEAPPIRITHCLRKRITHSIAKFVITH